MSSQAWRWLFVGGITAGVAAAVGCSSGEDPPAKNTGSGGSGAMGGTGAMGGSAGTGAAGKAGSATMGGTGGSTGGSAGAGTGGMSGSSTMGGSGGTPSTGGAPMGGMGGTAGMAGSAGSAGMATGGMAGASGSGGAAAGNGGGGMPATLVTPIDRSATSYVLEFGDTYFEVNPMYGGRVINVHLKGGQNLLGAGKDADNMGSTFWPSPQSAWTWPPTDSASITNINDKPYTPSKDDTSMTLVGMAASSIGISVTKKFAADLAKEAIVATYTMIGSGKMAAPWEITRFKQAGVTFYPTGSDTPKGNADMDPPAFTMGAGCTWVASPGTFASASAKDQKLFADGKDGWLAHAEDDWVIVKKFTDMNGMAATGESEIQVYMNNPGNTGNPTPYMEVEQQGAYGAVGTWTVTWFVRKLPSGVTAMAGSQALVDFVKSLVQ
ncbi:MAG TPA: hypothetical protein VNN72_27140 [Polyangiaceae bacterium]|nr:hypothetical protein [Polyangiaceae bacterium]